MIVTTYTCDRCAHDQTDDDQMWRIKLFVEYFGSVYDKQYPWKEVLWCRACVVSVLGALPQSEADPPQPDPEPTMEDMVRSIVQQEVAG